MSVSPSAPTLRRSTPPCSPAATAAEPRPAAPGLIAALLALLVAGCASVPAPEEAVAAPAVPVEHLVQAARVHLEERRFAEAALGFEAVLAQSPDDAQARLGLAEARLGAGRHAEAEALFSQLVESEGVRMAAREGLGRAQLARGDSGAARDTLEALVEEAPERWRGWLALAQLHDGERRWGEADAAYRRGLAAAPRKELLHNNWGVSLMARGEHARAAEQFRHALELRPDLAVARGNLELAYALLGRFDDVLAAARHEDRARTLNNLGYVAMQGGDLQRAEAYLVQALEAHPSFYPRAWHNLQQLQRLRRAEVES
jgi:Tfp pilus assembly protein PilF